MPQGKQPGLESDGLACGGGWQRLPRASQPHGRPVSLRHSLRSTWACLRPSSASPRADPALLLLPAAATQATSTATSSCPSGACSRMCEKPWTTCTSRWVGQRGGGVAWRGGGGGGVSLPRRARSSSLFSCALHAPKASSTATGVTTATPFWGTSPPLAASLGTKEPPRWETSPFPRGTSRSCLRKGWLQLCASGN